MFGKKKEGLYLRPRVRRTTPLMDIAFAVIMGGISGAYIFNDTFRRFQEAEGESILKQADIKPIIAQSQQPKDDE
ncbi:TPA: hypothetical protein N0F65_000054 [Lagenidium giganteum]|uniref:Uncharacterized protein n=1 Tax=Lagenidium giganteum TaxID=4803 RepID=A0AAV2YNM9_9STRA|nr:TPA: hypothetical protein N0F65_003045 [Lagenidium giganteum]DAZ94959.1 TPA: hypothetical protein N0F65_000054 [Lagenidium giganteum]